VTQFSFQKDAWIRKGWKVESLYPRPVPVPVSVPEGWKLVPMEPTLEMVEATWEDDAVMKADGYNAIRKAMYRAMLAASPTGEPK
jgi:hypothetical protein